MLRGVSFPSPLLHTDRASLPASFRSGAVGPQVTDTEGSATRQYCSAQAYRSVCRSISEILVVDSDTTLGALVLVSVCPALRAAHRSVRRCHRASTYRAQWHVSRALWHRQDRL